ncbi:uncharacterized protein STEHIDRAFT_50466, partial [Stereum hirsutum FP-91666 SS1]|uniref:uncharacterized protein n=1 Tax=Stereum hirsutum (strain FP-91666) TaxID=721885 RepID=UPI000440C73E
HSEFAALHLPALAQAFRSNNSIMSTSVMMLNVISHTPYFSRFLRSDAGKGMAILHAKRMAAHPAVSSLQGEELGEATQFLSTLLVYQGREGISQGDIQALTPKLHRWKTERVDSGGVLQVSADRCRAQLSPNLCVVFRVTASEFYRMLTMDRCLALPR